MRWTTAGPASHRANFSPAGIRQLCDSGAIDHVRTENGFRLIDVESLERFIAGRKAVGEHEARRQR